MVRGLRSRALQGVSQRPIPSAGLYTGIIVYQINDKLWFCRRLYAPAAVYLFKGGSRELDNPAVFSAEPEFAYHDIGFYDFPERVVPAYPGSFRGDKTALLPVKEVFISEAAEKAAAGAGYFHGI